MADSKHTPTPWVAEMVGISSAGPDGIDIYEITNGFRHIAEHLSEGDAKLIVAAVNEREELVKALGWFLDDERFQVGVGGNPNATEKMIAEARTIYTRAQVKP